MFSQCDHIFNLPFSGHKAKLKIECNKRGKMTREILKPTPINVVIISAKKKKVEFLNLIKRVYYWLT